jgi:signal transduction histidine kinase
VSEAAARKRGSLAGRLIGVAAIWSALVIIVTGYGLSALFRSSTQAAFDRELSISLDALAATIDTDPNGALIVPRPPPDPRFTKPLSGRYWRVVDVQPSQQLSGTGVKSRSLWDETIAPPSTLVATLVQTPGETKAENMRRGEETLRIAGRLVQLPARANPTLLVVAADRAEALEASNRFDLALGAGLMTLALGLLGAIFLQVRLGLEPVRQMGRQLSDIRNGLRERLEDDAPVELAPLAGELNALLSHNQAVVARARTQVGNLAHALKTPISVVLNESRQRSGPYASLIVRQTETMARQVEHYLKRASAAARAETLGARTQVAPVIDDVSRTLGRLFKADGVKVSAQFPDNLVFRGEREDLEDLIGNLAENACKYGGGLVEIYVAAVGTSQFEIVIDDDGEGLNDAQAVSALKRGARLDERLPGSGLGLSICEELARAYGGELHLERSPLGGLRARLVLPLAEGV